MFTSPVSTLTAFITLNIIILWKSMEEKTDEIEILYRNNTEVKESRWNDRNIRIIKQCVARRVFFKDVRCYVAQLGVLDHSALFEFRPPAFLSGDIFIFHAKINSSTFFISTYRTVCWQNGWIYWGFPHITCRHEAAAGSKYRQPNNLVIALCRCSEESGRWMFCPTRHPFCSQGLRQFSVIFMGSGIWWHFSQTHLCCWRMSV